MGMVCGRLARLGEILDESCCFTARYLFTKSVQKPEKVIVTSFLHPTRPGCQTAFIGERDFIQKIEPSMPTRVSPSANSRLLPVAGLQVRRPASSSRSLCIRVHQPRDQ